MRIKVEKSLKVGVAVSGGADSMVMLDLFRKEGYNLFVVNIEHGIRGQSSRADSLFVKDYCQKFNLPFLPFIVDAPKYAKEKSLSIELAARELRYQIFDRLLSEKTVDVIALAHHLDDQAETILMRLFRGSGLKGLRGITDREGYIHPMLDYSKQQILDYARDNHIEFRVDETNFDNSYTRNFIRNEVIPLIKTRYSGLDNTLAKTAKAFTEIDDYITHQAAKCQFDGEECWLYADILNQDAAVAKKSIMGAIKALGIEKDIEFNHLEAILALKKSQNNKRLTLPFSLVVYKEYDKLVFKIEKEKVEFCQPFDVNKEYVFNKKRYAFRGVNAVERGVFDLEKVPKTAKLRTRKKGDSFKRFKGGTKPLSEYLCDIKMPKRLRDSLLLIADKNIVLAVLGVEISEYIRVDESTKRIFKIEVNNEN